MRGLGWNLTTRCCGLSLASPTSSGLFRKGPCKGAAFVSMFAKPLQVRSCRVAGLVICIVDCPSGIGPRKRRHQRHANTTARNAERNCLARWSAMTPSSVGNQGRSLGAHRRLQNSHDLRMRPLAVAFFLDSCR